MTYTIRFANQISDKMITLSYTHAFKKDSLQNLINFDETKPHMEEMNSLLSDF